MNQGKPLADSTIERIRYLLEHSELTMPEIAKSVGCSHGPVAAINRKFQIRDYHGHHWKWTLVSHS